MLHDPQRAIVIDRGYVTADALKITQELYDALVTVRDKLNSGEITDYDLEKPVVDNDRVIFGGSTVMGRKMLKMSVVGKVLPDCGTAACIGGFCLMEMKSSRALDDTTLKSMVGYYDRDKMNLGLYRLFYQFTSNYNQPDCKNAVKAIDAYLQGCERPWDKAFNGQTL